MTLVQFEAWNSSFFDHVPALIHLEKVKRVSKVTRNKYYKSVITMSNGEKYLLKCTAVRFRKILKSWEIPRAK